MSHSFFLDVLVTGKNANATAFAFAANRTTKKRVCDRHVPSNIKFARMWHCFRCLSSLSLQHELSAVLYIGVFISIFIVTGYCLMSITGPAIFQEKPITINKEY